jgi:hypothetical protein
MQRMDSMNSIRKEMTEPSGRRRFLTAAGVTGLSAAAALLVPGKASAADLDDRHREDDLDNLSRDTAAEIFTAALIAEDLATTFYYNGLIGPVIQDPNLAGPGGSATNVTSNGNLGNVNYLQAALSEEIQHADLLRSLLGGKSAGGDPVKTFYLPTGCFSSLSTFTAVLDALENAFIGAYLEATIEFAQMASDTRIGCNRQKNPVGGYFESRNLEYFAQVSASIMGIESEHRVLGRVISNTNPANQLNYEQTDGLTSVYNGKHSAVSALTPFLAPGAGLTAYSFSTAIDDASSVSIPTTGSLPAAPVYPGGERW